MKEKKKICHSTQGDLQLLAMHIGKKLQILLAFSHHVYNEMQLKKKNNPITLGWVKIHILSIPAQAELAIKHRIEV